MINICVFKDRYDIPYNILDHCKNSYNLISMNRPMKEYIDCCVWDCHKDMTDQITCVVDDARLCEINRLEYDNIIIFNPDDISLLNDISREMTLSEQNIIILYNITNDDIMDIMTTCFELGVDSDQLDAYLLLIDYESTSSEFNNWRYLLKYLNGFDADIQLHNMIDDGDIFKLIKGEE